MRLHITATPDEPERPEAAAGSNSLGFTNATVTTSNGTYQTGPGTIYVGDHQPTWTTPGIVYTSPGTMVAAPPPLPDEDDETTPVAPEEDEPTDAARAGLRRWVLAVEGIETGDGRTWLPGAFTWRDLPLPFMAQDWTDDEHKGAKLVANMVEIAREGSEIVGYTEDIQSDDPVVLNLQRLIANGDLRGVSVDMDNLEGVVRFPEEPPLDPEADSMPLMMPKVEFSAARIIGATALPFPAFMEAKQSPEQIEQEREAAVAALMAGAGRAIFALTLTDDVDALRALCGEDPELNAALDRLAQAAMDGDDEDDDEPTDEDDEPVVQVAQVDEALVASISPPEAPPRSWFLPPSSSAPRTVTDDGRVSGYLAYHETCHIGLPGCQRPPRSALDYAAFLTGEIVTAEGDRLAVGQITVGAGHADERLKAQPAKEHYDHTGFAACDVVVGEDDIGIWYAGALRPHLEPAQVREWLAADVSGDWRKIKGNLELVGIASVNVPGFPKIEAFVAAGKVQSLVASALCPPEPDLDPVRARIAASIGRHPLQLQAQRDEIARRMGRHPSQRRAELIRRRFGMEP